MNRWRRICFFAVLFGIGFVARYAMAGGEAAGPRDSTVLRGQLEGQVTTASGAPLPGAVVAALPENPSGLRRTPEVRTDAEGRFRLVLPFGSYVVRGTASRFRTGFSGGAADSADAKPVVLDAGNPVQDVSMSLEPVSTLSGRVVDAVSGSPVDAGLVVAQGGVRRTAEVDSTGTYRIEGLVPGSYRVQAIVPGYVVGVYTGTDSVVTVQDGDRLTGIDMSVSRGLEVSGQVVDAQGSPLAGVTVQASPVPFSGRQQAAESDSSGTYRLTGLSEGRYLLSATKPAYGSVFYNNVTRRSQATLLQVAEDAQPDSIRFVLHPVGAIFGQVTARSDGSPLPGASVLAISQSGGRTYRGGAGPDGRYLISDLPAADYLVYATAEGYAGQFYPGAFLPDSAKAVQVLADTHTLGIDLALGKLSTVSGQVIDRQSAPIPGARVALKTGPVAAGHTGAFNEGISSKLFPGPGALSVETGTDGGFRFSGVPPGDYQVVAGASGFAEGAYLDAQGAPATVAVGVEQNVTGVEVRLSRLGAISGQVTAADGSTLTGLEVVAVAVDSAGEPAAVAGASGSTIGTRLPGWSGRNGDGPAGRGYPGEIVDAAKGTYRIAGLPAGMYAVQASAQGYVTVWYPDSDSLQTAKRLQVALESEVKGVDLTLSRGGSISGRVLAADTGDPILHASVTASRSDGSGFWQAEADGSGAYTLGGLSDGSYVVYAQATGFTGGFYSNAAGRQGATPVTIASRKPVQGVDIKLARRSPGDFDGNGRVDFSDVLLLVHQMGRRPSQQASVFDLNGDGRVDFEDFLALLQDLRGAGKAALGGTGALTWQRVDGGPPGELDADLQASGLPASQGYVVRVSYDPAEAKFLGARGDSDGLFGSGDPNVYEDGSGTIVVAGAGTNGSRGSGPVARLRFQPLGESVGVTLETKSGMTMTEDGRVAALSLPPAQRLELPPQTFVLQQNVPNPFNPVTTIEFELPRDTYVELAVYNLLGQRVRTLVQETRAAGRYHVSWDGRDDLGQHVSSGVYFYQLKTPDFSAARRMLLLQ